MPSHIHEEEEESDVVTVIKKDILKVRVKPPATKKPSTSPSTASGSGAKSRFLQLMDDMDPFLISSSSPPLNVTVKAKAVEDLGETESHAISNAGLRLRPFPMS